MEMEAVLKENYLLDIGWAREQLEVLSKNDLDMVYQLTNMTIEDLHEAVENKKK